MKVTSAKAFATYLAKHWSGDFHHQYEITKRAVWNRWREKNSGTLVWHCTSLRSAAENYSWGKDADSEKYATLCKSLEQAVGRSDNEAAANDCLAVFKWGGVSRRKEDRSCTWVEDARKDGTLSEKIIKAVQLLAPTCEQQLDRFHAKDLLMNSSLTKVYAAADPDQKIIIYDGRVGAALGLLVRQFLASRNETVIPEELTFGWGAPSAAAAAAKSLRDPSDEVYKFTKLPNTWNNTQADRVRADQCRRANAILAETVEQVRRSDPSVSAQRLEQALFMIGYSVRG